MCAPTQGEHGRHASRCHNGYLIAVLLLAVGCTRANTPSQLVSDQHPDQPADGRLGEGLIGDGSLGDGPGDSDMVGSSYRPSNVGDRISFDDAASDMVVGALGYSYWLVDTDSGAITAYDRLPMDGASSRSVRAPGVGSASGIGFIPLPMSGGHGAGVFTVGRLDVPMGTTVIPRGQASLIVMASRSITIDGTVAANADYLPGERHAGAGGFPGGSPSTSYLGGGPGGGSAGTVGVSGGAGGSFGGAGGASAPGAVAAGAINGTVTLVPLYGGSGGGGSSATGGNGGGAVQFSALKSLSVGLTGIIDVCGGGGVGGKNGISYGVVSGGGGGAGGAILLEAPLLTMDGWLGANGGAGGGAARAYSESAHGPGGDPRSAPVLPLPSPSGTTSGGAGSDPLGQAVNGLNASGGGGGGGRIRINTTSASAIEDRGLLPTLASGLATVGSLEAAGGGS